MEADYTDTYTTVLRNTSRMTAKDLFRMMFVYYPKPVQYLLRFRDWLVKPFGLQGGDGFTDLIKEKDEGQVTFGKSDKHLEFQALEPILSRNIIKLQITDNHILSKV